MKNLKYIFLLITLLLSINCGSNQKIITFENSDSNTYQELLNLAPNFTLDSINENTINYASNTPNSKPKFLFFFSRFWGKCRSELRSLIPLYSLYSDNIEFLIISIEQNELKSELKTFSIEQNYPWEIFSADKETLKSLNVTQQSTKIFIDKKNKIIYKADYGKGSASEWTELFNNAINLE